jgi:hypothetical protein
MNIIVHDARTMAFGWDSGDSEIWRRHQPKRDGQSWSGISDGGGMQKNKPGIWLDKDNSPLPAISYTR